MSPRARNETGGGTRRELLRLPSTWQTLAADAAWRVRYRRPVPSLPPTWPVPAADAARVVLRWPARYAWPPSSIYVDPLRTGLSRLVRIEPAEIPQPYRGVVMLEATVDGRRHDIAVDYGDDPELQTEAVARSSLYFKMQFLDEGYGHGTVVPGGFVPASQSVYRYLAPLRALRDEPRFAADVYGRFRLSDRVDVRRRAVEMLSEQSRFSYRGDDGLVLYTRHLRDIALARVCLDLPGLSPICFRLIDYLAVGACVVGPRPRTRLHVPLEEGRHVTYVPDDVEGLVDACAALVADEATRERRCRETSEFFDRYLHRDQLAGYYLRTLLDTLASR